MSGVLRTAAALRDLDEIYLFIARDNPRAADELLGQLQERAALHAGSPLLGSPHAELGNEIRSFVVGRYVTFSLPHRDGILILRVLHSARDIPPLFLK